MRIEIYSNTDHYTVIGTLAIDGCAVTFGTPTQSPPCCTKCNSTPINGQCTNFILMWHYNCLWTRKGSFASLIFNLHLFQTCASFCESSQLIQFIFFVTPSHHVFLVLSSLVPSVSVAIHYLTSNQHHLSVHHVQTISVWPLQANWLEDICALLCVFFSVNPYVHVMTLISILSTFALWSIFRHCMCTEWHVCVCVHVLSVARYCSRHQRQH